MINNFNHTSGWVISTILREEAQKLRYKVFEKFIKIAQRLADMRNFNSCFAILSGLNSVAIYRLKMTRKCSLTKTYQCLTELTSSAQGYKNLRDKLISSAGHPCVPYLGLFLRDLIYINDNLVETSKHTWLINFFYCYHLADVIGEIRSFQEVAYTIREISGFIEMATDHFVLDKDDEYKISLYYEPRYGGCVTCFASDLLRAEIAVIPRMRLLSSLTM